MARQKMEEKLGEFEIDDSPVETVKVETKEEVKPEPETIYKKKEAPSDMPLVNCLRNERVIVRYIPKETGLVSNPKHILYGGMAENSTRTFVVPRLQSGMYVNILTDSEKAYLEDIMGLEYNALSVYKKVNNFWDDSNESGISRVRLTKQDNFLNLADPRDYIKYKILLANKDYIAPSLRVLQDSPKATYQFVIIAEGDETEANKSAMSNTMKCYKEYGKIEEDIDTLRMIVETIDGRPTAPNVKLDFLQAKINSLIQADSKLFLKVVTDPLLSVKVLIRKGIDRGLISHRGDFYYLRENGSPLCEMGEDPTLSVAATYLSSPKHQELLFSLQAKLK